MRTGNAAFDAAAAEAGIIASGIIASNQGNAKLTPAPRRTVLREIGNLCLIIGYLPPHSYSPDIEMRDSSQLPQSATEICSLHPPIAPRYYPTCRNPLA